MLGRRLLVGAVVLLLLGSFTGWWVSTASDAALRRSAPALVTGAKPIEPQQADRIASALRQRLIAAPIDQDLVNRHYALVTVNRLEGEPARDGWRRQVAALGWRTTAAQQNLLIDAAYRNDFRTMLDRTDAMLRRERLVGELVAVLYLVEQAPETHDVLVSRLRNGAPWRSGFFADPRGVSTSAGRQARYATVEALLASGKVARAELVPLLSALVSSGEKSEAYRFWQRFRARSGGAPAPSGGVSFDPDLAVYVASLRDKIVAELPFEWEPLAGAGYSADIDRTGLALHWDGSGVPVLLRQAFRAIPARYQLILTGADAAPELFGRFDIVAACPAGEIAFTRARRVGTDGVALDTDEPIACEFPTLLVRGRPGMVSQPVEASLRSIVARPIRA